ncbi:response regulator transcription factor [Acetivibrio cellulolyticus]|uniref:response regulator transcription factor n=1 Tax=Acetivibrio cellulolyticus TaxID=35830 RepID=UPI0001E3052A|nr:response regulator transcription factor [Acetivibrio cellulolyticus]
MGYRILIIEDELKIARFLELELVHEGYDVVLENDGRSGCDKALAEEFDLLILDLMLPCISGIEVCRRIRRQSQVPIIILTAKDDVSDKVMGLDTGANDYMTKPFAIEELLARMRGILKRYGTINVPNDSNVLSAGKLTLDPDKFKVTYDNEDIPLTKKEFQLLMYLMNNEGLLITREKILENIWGIDYMGLTNVTDVYIRYLRTKIDDKYGVKLIHTIRGMGYKFNNEGI